MEKSSKMFPREKLTFSAADKMQAQIIAQGVSVYLGDHVRQKFMDNVRGFALAVADAAASFDGETVLPGNLPAAYIISKPGDVFYHAQILIDMVSQCGEYGRKQLLDDLKALLRSVERDCWQQGQNYRVFAT